MINLFIEFFFCFLNNPIADPRSFVLRKLPAYICIISLSISKVLNFETLLAKRTLVIICNILLTPNKEYNLSNSSRSSTYVMILKVTKIIITEYHIPLPFVFRVDIDVLLFFPVDIDRWSLHQINTCNNADNVFVNCESLFN